MSTQRVSSIKIPMFDKENYNLWKKKMTLFLQAANPKYKDVLKKGPNIPMIIELENVVDGIVISPARMYPKDPKEYSADEKEDAALDINLQLILVESLDPIMYNHVVNCKDAKHIWETIETINEGTEEVRENRLEILVSEYEHFRSTPGEGISEVFERYNKLINNLNLHGKAYTIREINRKFLLTLPTHLEHRITAIRESRDMNEISLERLYGILKTYELEQIQQKEIYGKGRVVSTSTALVAEAPEKQKAKVVQPSNFDKNMIIAEYGETPSDQTNGDFYSMEELEQLEDESMALIVKNFGKFRFRRNPNFRFKSTPNRFQKGGSSNSNSPRGGYKSGTVDKSKILCYNCNELGHYATECKKPKQAKRRDTYEELEQKYNALLKKQSGRAYIAEGKSWDDSDNDDEESGNLALMASSDIASTSKPASSSTQVTLTDTEMIYNLGGTLDCARRENDRIILQNTALEVEVKELRKVHINQDKLKEEVAFLENRVKCYKQVETLLREKVAALESKVNAYLNSAKLAKDIFNQQAISQTVGICFDYNQAAGMVGINTPNKVSVEERGIPHVLKGVNDPLFKESIGEPFDETSLLIKEEMLAEDTANVQNNVLPEKDIKSKNVQSDRCVPKGSVKVDQSASPSKTNLGKHKLKQHDIKSNMHNMPSIDLSHKYCGVANCMSCAFNVMSAYFTSKHPSTDKTAPRQHMNNKKHAKPKTDVPPKARVKAFIPKPKQKIVKAVYKVKCSVNAKEDVIKIKNVVLPDKGQFFKYAGPNQIWVPKKV